jgi:hypothetical protein
MSQHLPDDEMDIQDDWNLKDDYQDSEDENSENNKEKEPDSFSKIDVHTFIKDALFINLVEEQKVKEIKGKMTISSSASKRNRHPPTTGKTKRKQIAKWK